MKQYLEFLEQYKKLKEELIEKGKTEFTSICQTFFKETPEVKTVKWKAYTPYFNDGDPCNFSVHEPIFSNSEDASIVLCYGEIDSDDESLWATPAYAMENSQTKENCQIFAKIIQSSDFKPVMLALFGDHVQVTVTPEGIESVRCSHD